MWLQPGAEAVTRGRAIELNAALALAVSAAPKSAWHQQDAAGRLPLHHLLENPLRRSRVGTVAFAELEMNLACMDGRHSTAVVGGARIAAGYSAAGDVASGHAASARAPSLSASGQASFAAMGGGGGRRGGRTSASLGLGHSDRGTGPRGF